MIGSSLAHYRIAAKLGGGGMGEVYRATDTKLGRDVALKLLPEAFASDPERLARFEREARVLAAFNHPSIAHVYGFERATLPDGSAAHFLAMELVEGEDLAERLKRGAIPVDEALGVAKQIAEALEEAHEKGIVHRDLKPANIKLTPDGKVKVLDFGLAKAYAGESASGSSADLSRSPTLTHTGTQAGVILGTAAYMSPEQARGQPVDKRADIWAFGVVLFEMLSGQRAFRGGSVTETLASVIRDEPDLDALAPDVPAGVRRLIERCLRKEPRERLRDIGDARHEIEETRAGGPAPSPPPGTRAHRVKSTLPWLVSAILVLTTLAGWLGRSARTGPETPLRRFAIDLPWQSVPNWTDFDVALSPKGTHFAYYGRRNDDNDVDVYVRALDGLDAVQLGDAREADGMAFSPDGEWLVLLDHRGLRKVSIHGGRAQPLARLEHAGEFGLSWGPDGTILVGHASGLLRAPSSGGPAETLTRVDTAAGETGHLYPFHLPGGTHALMTIAKGEQMQLAIVDLARATYHSLPLSGSQAAYSASGHVVFRQGASVLAARFDPSAPAVVGEAVPVLEKVRRGPYLAADGTMLYVAERGDSNARLVWVDRNGRPTPIPGERLDYSHLALGASGRQALLNITSDVYVRDIERGTRRHLYSVYLRAADGSAPVRLGEGIAHDISPDGASVLVLVMVDPPRLMIYPTGAGEPRDISAEGFVTYEQQTAAHFFRDGRSVAFCGNQAGKASRCYVRDLAGGPARAVTPEGTDHGRVSPDGTAVVARGPDGRYRRYPLDGVGPVPVPGLDDRDEIITWRSDGRSLLVYRPVEIPARVDRVDLSTGQRTLLRELAPADRAGALRFYGVSFSADEKSYAYGLSRGVGSLYAVEGVR